MPTERQIGEEQHWQNREAEKTLPNNYYEAYNLSRTLLIRKYQMDISNNTVWLCFIIVR